MQLLPANGSTTIAPEENYPASPPPTLTLTLILTVGNFPRRNCSDTLLIWMNLTVLITTERKIYIKDVLD